MSERLPDLEVYVKCPDIKVMEGWLQHQFAELKLIKARHSKPESYLYQAKHGDAILPLTLVFKVVGGFSSLWIDSNKSPWKDDAELADALSSSLGLEVRYAKQGWSEGNDVEVSDVWIKVSKNGKSEIQWKT